MANVVAIVSARQVGPGGALEGALRAPLPGLNESAWIEVSREDFSIAIIGEDSSAIYIRSSIDFGGGDYDVIRISAIDGESTVVSGYGAGPGRYIGPTYLALPLGDLDAILFGRDAIVRIQADEELWRMDLTGQDGWVMADAAAVSGGTITVIYQKADFAKFRAINYRALTFSASAPPASTSMATWSVYPVDWTLISQGDWPRPRAAAIIGAIAPGLDYAVASQQGRSSDGWLQESRCVLLDAYEDAGLPTVSHYANFSSNDESVSLAQLTANVTISGGSIVAASESIAPATQRTTDIPLPALTPPYNAWEVSNFFDFALSFEPLPPPDAFWTNLRRAIEVV